MTLDERFAEFQSTVAAEIARARREGIADVLRVAARIRRASSEAERMVAFEDAKRTFEGNATVLEFLKTLAAPALVSHEESNLRAQRFARVRVAEIQLYHAAAMKNGLPEGQPVFPEVVTGQDRLDWGITTPIKEILS